jgi:hypothetical protein
LWISNEIGSAMEIEHKANIITLFWDSFFTAWKRKGVFLIAIYKMVSVWRFGDQSENYINVRKREEWHEERKRGTMMMLFELQNPAMPAIWLWESIDSLLLKSIWVGELTYKWMNSNAVNKKCQI